MRSRLAERGLYYLSVVAKISFINISKINKIYSNGQENQTLPKAKKMKMLNQFLNVLV